MSDAPQMPPAAGFNLPPGVSLRDIDPPDQDIIVCPSCGKDTDGNLAQCQHCGYEFETP